MSLAVSRCDGDRLPAQHLCFGICCRRPSADGRQSSDHALLGIKAFGWLSPAAGVFCRVQLGLDRRHDPFGDLVLHGEDVAEIAVVALGPNVIAGFRLDQLRGDPQPVAALADASFEHVAHAELASDLLHINRAAFVDEAAVACDDKEPPELRQRRGDVFDHAIGEDFLLGVGAHVRERKRRDRGLVWERQWFWRARRRPLSGDRAVPNSVNPHGSRDVLDLLLAHVREDVIELVTHLIANDPADADPARFRERLQPRGHVHPVPEDVVFSTMTSPRLTPMRNLMRRSSGTFGSRSAIPRWISVAQRTASTTLWNSAKNPSPVFFTIRPLCSVIFGLTSSPRWILSRS